MGQITKQSAFVNRMFFAEIMPWFKLDKQIG